jgi:hypothetical protein
MREANMQTLSDEEQFEAAESLEHLRLQLENIESHPIPPAQSIQPDGSSRPSEDRVLDMRRALAALEPGGASRSAGRPSKA